MLNALDQVTLGAHFVKEIEAAGFRVDVVEDLERVQALAERTGRLFQMPTFSIAKSHLTTQSAFWLFLFQDDEPVGAAAATLQDLGPEPFDLFLKRTYRHQFPHPSGQTILEVAPPLRDVVHGRLAYIGELNFHPSIRGPRKVLGAFMQLLQLLCAMQWDVDWMYAFIPDRHMRGRLDLVYGFTTSIPAAQRWNPPEPDVRSSSEWFVGTPRAHFEHAIRWRADLIQQTNQKTDSG